MQTLDYLMLANRYLHIFGAIALMGGTIFARFVVLPTLSDLPGDQRERIHTALRAKWSKIVSITSGLLLLSGIANLGIYGANFEFPSFPYNPVAGVKFLLALPIFLIAALLAGKTSLAAKLQANAKFWMNVNLALAVVMVLIGGGLRFIERKPKTPKPTAQIVSDEHRTASAETR